MYCYCKQLHKDCWPGWSKDAVVRLWQGLLLTSAKEHITRDRVVQYVPQAQSICYMYVHSRVRTISTCQSRCPKCFSGKAKGLSVALNCIEIPDGPGSAWTETLFEVLVMALELAIQHAHKNSAVSWMDGSPLHKVKDWPLCLLYCWTLFSVEVP